MGQVTNGLQKIEVSEIGVDNWRVLGNTNIDSATASEEEGTTTDFNVEEFDDPLHSRYVPGKTVIAFQIADPNLQSFLECFGGQIIGTGDAAVYHAPSKRPQKIFKIRFTPEIGYGFQFNKTLFKPRFNGAFGKNNLVMIDVSADILNPNDGVTPPWGSTGLVSGAGGSSTAQTITFADPADIADGATATLTATTTSGLPVSFASDNPAVISISGNTMTGESAGTANIIATQPGNATYAPATPIVRSVTVTP